MASTPTLPPHTSTTTMTTTTTSTSSSSVASKARIPLADEEASSASSAEEATPLEHEEWLAKECDDYHHLWKDFPQNASYVWYAAEDILCPELPSQNYLKLRIKERGYKPLAVDIEIGYGIMTETGRKVEEWKIWIPYEIQVSDCTMS